MDGNEKESADLRPKLDELNQKKEDAFARKQEISALIGEKIRQISEFRRKRNELTGLVRSQKKDRDALNAQITEKIAEIKKARPAPKPMAARKEAPLDAKGRPLRPRAIEQQIALLEERLETMPMGFDAEQKLVKQIKQLKKQHGELSESAGLSGELAGKSKEIDDLKKAANELHAKVTECAKESQQYHEKMLALSAEIEELKKEEEDKYKEFLAHKEEYMRLSGDVKDAQTEVRKARKAEKSKEAEERKRKDADEQKTLKQRAKEAEEKMVKGEKLTTEDLLAMQSVRD